MLAKGLRRLMNELFPGVTEIQKVEAALKQYHAEQEEYDRIFSDNDMACCPHCAFSPDYGVLADKIERVEQWLGILKLKQQTR